MALDTSTSTTPSLDKAAPSEKVTAPKKRVYTVQPLPETTFGVTAWTFNGEQHVPGDTVQLTADEAQPLVEAGVLSE